MPTLLRLTRVLVLVPLLWTGACYQYVATPTAVPVGREVALLVTDRGRAALSERVGPELDQLRGTLVSRSDTSVTVAMRQTLSLRGTTAAWSAETLTVRSDLLASVRERRLSTGRTVALAGGITAVVASFIVSRGFLNGNSEVETDPSKPPTGPGPSTVRIPLTLFFRSH